MQTIFNTKSSKKYYYIKNGVVYDITTKKDGEDQCAYLIDDEKLPSVTVEYYKYDDEGTKIESATTNVTYYLDTTIKDGDISGTPTTGTSCIFKKTIHKESGDEELSTYIDALKVECKETIKNIIKTYPSGTLDFLKKRITSNIPSFMYVDYYDRGEDEKNWEISGSSELIDEDAKKIAIDITNDEVLEGYRKEACQEDVYDVAVRRASLYGYGLTDPASAADVGVEKLNN